MSDYRSKIIINEIVEHVKKEECILFIGAGVHSAPPAGSLYKYSPKKRPPMGGDLAEQLAKKCCFKEQLPEELFPDESPRDLQRVALCYERTEALGRPKLVRFLNSCLRVDKEPSPVLRMLVELPFKIFVTTNYDQLLEKALANAGKEPYVIIYNPKFGEPAENVDEPSVEQPLLFKMHGDLKKSSTIVITDEDYITFIQRMMEKENCHPVPQTVRSKMVSWPTLFVGYRLRDYNLRLLFSTLRLHRDKADIQDSFSVDKLPDPLIEKVWKDKHLVFVSQDIWTFVPRLFKEVKGKDYPYG